MSFPTVDQLRRHGRGRQLDHRAARRPAHRHRPRPPRAVQPGRRRAGPARPRRAAGARPTPTTTAWPSRCSRSRAASVPTSRGTGVRPRPRRWRSTAGSPSRPGSPIGPARYARAPRRLARAAHRARGARSTSTRPTVATVVEVHGPDGVGVLYRITRAIAELDLDIRSAKVQTLGDEVVDSFYLRDRDGAKVTDPDYLAEIERLRCIGSLVRDRRPRSAGDAPGPAALERGAGRHRPHRARLHREPVRAGAVRGGAGRRGRHPASPPGSHFDRDELVDEWMKLGRRRASPATSDPKVAVGAVVGNDAGRDPARPAGRLRRLAVPDRVGRHRLLGREVAVKEVHEETGIECEVVRLIGVFDGLRLGFTRIPLYSLVFHCRAIGGALAPHPLETRRRRLVRRGRPARAARRRRALGRAGVRRHPGRAGRRALRRAAQPTWRTEKP